jgi:hypothetical protein
MLAFCIGKRLHRASSIHAKRDDGPANRED